LHSLGPSGFCGGLCAQRGLPGVTGCRGSTTTSSFFTSTTSRLPASLLILFLLERLFIILTSTPQVLYYSTRLFRDAGIGLKESKYATMGVGVVMVFMTLVSIPLMDRAGRRTLHLYGLGGMFIFSIFITISLLIQVRGASSPSVCSCRCVVHHRYQSAHIGA
jgi:SP family facilitated glucose transporter-like MFS transporter 1